MTSDTRSREHVKKTPFQELLQNRGPTCRRNLFYSKIIIKKKIRETDLKKIKQNLFPMLQNFFRETAF